MNDPGEALRARLRRALDPENKQTKVDITAGELGACRKEAERLGLNYSKLLAEVCTSISSERKKPR